MVALRGLLSSNYLPAVVPKIALRSLPIFCLATFLLFWFLSKEWVEPKWTNRWPAKRLSVPSHNYNGETAYIGECMPSWRIEVYWTPLEVLVLKKKTKKQVKLCLWRQKMCIKLAQNAKLCSNSFLIISVNIKTLIKPNYANQNAFSWRAYPVPDTGEIGLAPNGHTQ